MGVRSLSGGFRSLFLSLVVGIGLCPFIWRVENCLDAGREGPRCGVSGVRGSVRRRIGGMVSAVPPGLDSFLGRNPAMNRWATIGRPSGTGRRGGIAPRGSYFET